MVVPGEKNREEFGKYLGLAGKKAVVTGGARGAGKAVAERFLDVGCNVVILDINDEEGKKTAEQLTGKGRITFINCDITEYDRYSEILHEIDHNIGIDVMVHNAGIPQKPGTIEDISKEEIERILRINLHACIYGVKIVTPLMAKRGGGVQIVTSSTVGIIGMEQRAIYTATKHAVNGFVKAMGIDYAEHNVRFISVAPARMRTPFIQDLLANLPEGPERKRRESEYNLTAGIFRRMMEPEEVADVVLFAASDLSRGITGEIIEVGGLSNGVNLLTLLQHTCKDEI